MKNDKEATSTTDGLKHEECTVCKYKKEAEVIPIIKEENNINNEIIPDDNTITNNNVNENIDNSINTPDTGDEILLFVGLGIIVAIIIRKKTN